MARVKSDLLFLEIELDENVGVLSLVQARKLTKLDEYRNLDHSCPVFIKRHLAGIWQAIEIESGARSFELRQPNLLVWGTLDGQ
jgi:hypothetical protein